MLRKPMTRGKIKKLVDDEVAERPEALLDILSTLSNSAYDTAQHIHENWQDAVTAKVWEKVGGRLWTALMDVHRLLKKVEVGTKMEF